jgi:hypothetical protein
MDKPETFKIHVADIVIVQREVECPLICPHCDHDLTTTGADGELKLLIDSVDEVTEHGAIEVDEGLDAPNLTFYETDGSDSLAYLDVRCDACRKSVLTAPGTLRNTMADGVVTT